MDGGRGEDGAERHAAVGRVDVELVARQVSRTPRAFLFVSRSQAFGRSSSIASRLMPFACRSRRESAFGLSSPLRGRPGRRFGVSVFGFAVAAFRLSMAVESRDTWPMSASLNTSPTSASCILCARPVPANCANARENVASLGIAPTRDQPHSRRNAGSALSLSIRCRVVERSHKALARNARAKAHRGRLLGSLRLLQTQNTARRPRNRNQLPQNSAGRWAGAVPARCGYGSLKKGKVGQSG